MKRLLPAIVVLVLSVAAGKPWVWDLPGGLRPPPITASNQMNMAKVELGRRLFYDADLSANGTMACAACHEQRHAFADGNATRPGVHGDPGRRNVPGLGNIGWFSPLTYADPRVVTLEAQVLIPLIGERPVEMGMKGIEQELAKQLGADSCYRTNVAVTGPWWQDGTGTTLGSAIQRHPKPPPDSDLSDLSAYLGALTDSGFITDPRLAPPDRACGAKL